MSKVGTLSGPRNLVLKRKLKNSNSKDLAVLKAVLKLKLPDVASALKKSPDNINSIDETTGDSALHLAVLAAANEIVLLFIQQPGLDVNIRNWNGATPLHKAIPLENFRDDIFLDLLNAGADKNLVDKNDLSPLATVINTDPPNDIAVKLLTEKGADINQKSSKGATSLHAACHAGRASIVKYLVRKGADVNVPNEIGNTPLHIAALHNVPAEAHEMIHALLLGGADPSISNRNH